VYYIDLFDATHLFTSVEEAWEDMWTEKEVIGEGKIHNNRLYML